MEINAVKGVESTGNYSAVSKNSSNSIENPGNVVNIGGNSTGKNNDQLNDATKGKKSLSKAELLQVNEELNHFMGIINSDIQFAIHERSKQLMVQVVDTKDNRVLKEFPSHEMLDVMANIREYIGALLDKKA